MNIISLLNLFLNYDRHIHAMDLATLKVLVLLGCACFSSAKIITHICYFSKRKVLKFTYSILKPWQKSSIILERLKNIHFCPIVDEMEEKT
jgi:hypothetical protein